MRGDAPSKRRILRSILTLVSYNSIYEKFKELKVKKPSCVPIRNGCLIKRKVRWARSSQGLTENGVVGVHGDLIFGGVPDETLGLREGHIAGGRAVTLIVGDDLDFAVLEDADAGVSRAKIDTNRGCLRHFFRVLQGKTWTISG